LKSYNFEDLLMSDPSGRDRFVLAWRKTDHRPNPFLSNTVGAAR
jgi:hypothetical protein